MSRLPTRLRTVAVLAFCVLELSGRAGAVSLSVSSASLTAVRTCVLSGLTSTSTADVDTFANQGSPTNTNGTANTANVNSASGANRRIYIRFDLSTCSPAIPSTATVLAATMRLFATAIPTACETQDIFRVTSSWGETTLTWNNQPFGTSINNPASSSKTSSIGVGSSPCQNSSTSVYVTGWDVAADVAAFVSGTSNYGWMIRDDVEGSGTSRTSTYSTREAANSLRAPQLSITYR